MRVIERYYYRYISIDTIYPSQHDKKYVWIYLLGFIESEGPDISKTAWNLTVPLRIKGA